ncbi:MAG TPA: NAD(P)-dependent oxidoreductase [Solirubrobacteraceae bacterium]|nr:NAD(P)-dependent oxidoreductase [Solirubrobacteraceae bacterium]
MICWVEPSPGHEAMGEPPAGWSIAPFPDDPVASPDRDEVEFVVPDWQIARELHALPALKVVQTRSAGVEWIVGRVPDGVTLCSARGARDAAMAEWVAWALLADAKAARTAAEQQVARVWEHLDLRDVEGARVLILGHGSIGAAVERRLAAFDARIVRVARRARDGVHAVDELPCLLPSADVVVNLLPATEETRGLVGAEALAAMPRGGLLVNAGRGSTVDTDALLRALHAGHVRAVLDVTEPEPLPADHPLWSAPGLIVTPHSAGDTPGAERKAWALAGDQLRRHAAGEPLRNVVSGGY